MKLKGQYKNKIKNLPKSIITFALLQEGMKKTFPQYKQQELSLYYIRNDTKMKLEDVEDFNQMLNTEYKNIKIFLRDEQEMQELIAIENIKNHEQQQKEGDQEEDEYGQEEENVSNQNQNSALNYEQQKQRSQLDEYKNSRENIKNQRQQQSFQPKRSSQIDNQEESSLHTVECRQCSKQITAPLYKCTGCHDYELCCNCFKNFVHNKDHEFMKIQDQFTWKRVNYHKIINKLFNPKVKQEKQIFQFWIDSDDIMQNNQSFKEEMAHQASKLSELIAQNIEKWSKEYYETTHPSK